MYEEKEKEYPGDMDLIKGKLQCYKALSDWESLSHIVDEMWDKEMDNEGGGPFDREDNVEYVMHTTSDSRAQVANLAAYAAWNLGQWEKFDEYIDFIEEDTNAYDKNFFLAVINIHYNKFKEA